MAVLTDAEKIKRFREALGQVAASYINEGRNELATRVVNVAQELDFMPETAAKLYDIFVTQE